MKGQIGINTTSPKGALDIGSSTMGVVLPVVSLPDPYTETIVNPNGGSIIAGTTVYNNNSTINGADSMYPGIYFWNGSKWISQRERKDNKLFTQNTDLRPESSTGKQNISFDNNTFTPIFTGQYKITLTVHFGGGTSNIPSGSQHVNFVKQEGQFEFIFDGSTYLFSLSSYSGSNDDKLFKGGSGSSIINYTNSINQTSYNYEKTLSAGTPYSFTLTFDQADAVGFEGDGNIIVLPLENGSGYITINDSLKCSVEINYTGE
ncbi:MAG: hypothetical protein QM499_09820 [Flavobacteriaceae bacterium]